jgi:hypothetical protein
MTDYIGTFSGNRIESLGPTPAYPHGSSISWVYNLEFNLSSASVDSTGTVSGAFSASGTVTRTFSITGPVNPALPPDTTVQPFAIAPTSFTALRDAFTVGVVASALGLSPPATILPGPLDTLYWGGGSARWDGNWNDGGPSQFSFNYEVGLTRSSPLYSFETVWIPVPTPEYPNAAAENPAEGDSGTTLYSFDIVRDIGIDRPSSVAWAVEPFGTDPASADDFAGGVFPTGAASFVPGQTRVRITVPVSGDTAEEPDERFLLVQPGKAGDLVGLPTSYHVAGIGNDDAPPRLVLTPIALDVTEGDAPGNQISFRIDRDGKLAQPSTLRWWLIGTGPRPLLDSHLQTPSGGSGTLVIPAGEPSALVTVPLAGGTAGNQDHHFSVIASYVSGPLPNSQFGVLDGTVHDDDAPPNPAELAVLNTSTGLPQPVDTGWYNGAVYDLEKAVILLGSDGIVLVASTPNWFLRTGSGNDAIAAGSGVNVLDGGTGSNFLSGQGRDSFFVDARGLAAPVWSTVVGRDSFDTVSVWIDKGIQPTIFWDDNQGADGYRGLTMHVAQPGRPLASLTMPGFTLADTLSSWVGISWVAPRVFTFLGTSSDGEVYIGVNAIP